MGTRVLRLLFPLTAALLLSGCPGRSDNTEILLERTLDILNEIEGVPDHVRSAEITGFQIGPDLGAPMRTTVSATLPETRLEGAGAEAGLCNDGAVHTFPSTSELVSSFAVIGDTGADDVSDDGDCGCDTKISAIVFNRIQLRIDSRSSFGFDPLILPDFLRDASLLCPNIPDGDQVRGDREFGGPVLVNAEVTLRVAGGRLLLDVTYRVRETI